MIAIWIAESMRRATNREPKPARTSSSVIAFGSGNHDPVVEVHVGNARRVRRGTSAGVERARAARRHAREQAVAARRRRCAPARRRRIARRRPTSRSRAGSSPATRCSVDSNDSCSARRTAVYHTARARGTLREFVTHGYWRRMRERIGLVVIALVCLFGPALLGGYWAWRDPGAAIGVVPGQFQYVAEPRTRGEDWGVASTTRPRSRREIFTNNIRVAILAFAGGILLGVGALFMLLYNGLTLGATFGIAVGVGNGPPLFQQVLAHGFLELSCIVGRRARPGCAWAGRSSTRDRDRAASRCAKKRGPRPRCCSAPRRGSSSPASSRASSRRRARASATVLVVGVGLGVVFWGGVFWLGRAAPTRRRVVTGGRGPSGVGTRRRTPRPSCAGGASSTTAPVRATGPRPACARRARRARSRSP